VPPSPNAADRGEEIGETRTFPFIRFGIQLYHAFLTTIFLRLGNCMMWAMITFSDALFNGHCTKLRKEAREVVACAGIAGRGRATRLATSLWLANDKGLK
jgi:hypothetical protein